MNSSEPFLLRAARLFAFASAAAALFSIAVSQICLALAVAALLISGARMRFPPISVPLGLFVAGTLISMAFSDKPSDGLSQVRKFYLLLELLVIYSTFQGTAIVRRLVLCWTGLAALSSILGAVQFDRKLEQAREMGKPFYDFYMQERITGFMSHWMTYSGQLMFVLLLLLSMLLFGPKLRGKLLGSVVAGGIVIAVGLLLGLTRSVVFLAFPGAALFLIWHWKRWLVAVIPAVALAVVLFSPAPIRERFTSIFHPRKDVDSNEFRIITWRTGWEMIKARPLVGLGPERVKGRFMEFVPADIPRPLPSGWYGHLHNIYIHYAAERGIPTMLALMWLLGRMLWDFWRGARRLAPGRSDARFILMGAIAVILATMLEGFYELDLGDSEVLTMFLAVAAAGYVAKEEQAACAAAK